MTKIDELLAEAHQKLGLQKVEKDQLGVIRLLVNDIHLIHIRISHDQKSFCLYALAGKLPENNNKDLLEMLLEANLYPEENHDIQFSVHSQSKNIILSKIIYMNSCTPQSYMTDLEQFTSALTRWKQKLPEIKGQKKTNIEDDIMKLMSQRKQQIFMV